MDAFPGWRSMELHELHKQGIWVTKTGEKVPVSNMSNSHLVNTVNFLERNEDRFNDDAALLGLSVLSSVNGEMAQYEIEKGIDSYLMGYASALEETPIYQALLSEMERRGLNVTP